MRHTDYKALIRQFNRKGVNDTELGKLTGTNQPTIWRIKKERNHPSYKVAGLLDYEFRRRFPDSELPTISHAEFKRRAKVAA